MSSQIDAQHGLRVPSFGVFRGAERDIRRLGIQPAMARLLERSGSIVSVHGLTPAINKVLQDKATIVLSNHPHELDPLVVLAALPQRRDAYVIFTHTFTGMSPAFDEHVIPVYI